MMDNVWKGLDPNHATDQCYSQYIIMDETLFTGLWSNRNLHAQILNKNDYFLSLVNQKDDTTM